MKIGVFGVGTTKFGELWNLSMEDIAKQAIDSALQDAAMKMKDIDALYVGNMLSGILFNQANLASLISGIYDVSIPAFRLEGACASGGLALHNAILGIRAGQYKKVLVLGVEKMTDHSQEEVTGGLMGAGSEDERLAGLTFPGIYALMAQAYLQDYHVSEESLAGVSVKNHYHGSFNPNAQFQKPITVADVMKSTKVADPLKLLDCSPVSDGAAAVVIGEVTNEKKLSRVPIYITASEVAVDAVNLCARESLTSLKAVVLAAKKAYTKTGLTPQDIHVAEIHDCFSIAEAIATEDLGFSKRGKGAIDICNEKFTLKKGKTITNSSGGLKSCGHPVGATGIKQIVEIVEQLQGKANARQVDGAKIGLTHNVGGSGAVAVIHVLQKYL